MCEYQLGGKNNFAADREAAEKVLVGMPSSRTFARENRAFMSRAVQFLAGEAGIRQFLDIGTGLPAGNNVHEVAQEAHPDLRFTVGSMTALDAADAADGEFGGILAYYSTYHTPPEWLPTVFGEFHRTLAPGGYLLLGTYIGNDEHLRPTSGYGGHPMSYQSHLLPLERIEEMLGSAGLAIKARLVQEPDEHAKRRHANVLARKGP